MAKRELTIAVAISLALGACGDMSSTQQRTLSGGALGAGAGAIGGAIGGNAGLGAAIGAGVGLAGGYLYDQNQKSKEDAYQRGVAAGKASQ
jgi:osmotically inducible lipoprotein OsmB